MIFPVAEAEFVVVAVGTPPRPIPREADMRRLHAVAEEFAPFLSGCAVIAIKSIAPVGTGDKIQGIVASGNPASRAVFGASR